jgi:hypothetical protein
MGRPSNIWHVLPQAESQDFARKCRQNADRTFPPLDYGRTIYISGSVRQREMVTARAFDVCIIVEGGPGAAHEVEQFCWNDHIVIPVRSTGGAAGGKFNVPGKIFEVPAGVDVADWSVLSDNGALASEVGRAVLRIVTSIRDRLNYDLPSPYVVENSSPPDLVHPMGSDSNSSIPCDEAMTDEDVVTD